ncbi:hypothetical protein A2994_01565 [candidate division Kazan bacterium RIFCSPLOWO2_01_FULL_48_13]|uniref:Blue (type 1) copper domain-containing protein n=1 Tax=candidate division Kazan bacterium RIFCSPLOWO2_01_FULL_48_13 TaxID=1798539 RepID=A0A1F4PMQ6_UNCK3|nr:MAG: hypothetical protein A2994_01565 [candidate division Kazan bacterium RIFCSPLOWO2_01_FULL_48_13]
MKGKTKKHPVKNQKIAVAIIILAFVTLGFLFFYKGYLKPPLEEAPKKAAPSAFVDITEKGFSPQTILISKGETIQWVNKDSVAHQPASNPHPVHNGLAGFDAGKSLGMGETYQFTFEKEGTFGYHDHRAPTTNASVVVK